MQRWARVAMWALIVLVVGELGVRYQGDRLGPPGGWYHPIADVKAHDLASVPSPRTVVVGSSTVLHGVRSSRWCAGDPEVTYNAGLPVAYPQLAARWLSDAVVDEQQPELVVWGVSPGALDGNEFGLQALESYSNTRATRTNLLTRIERAAARHSALVLHRYRLREMSTVLTAIEGDRQVPAIDRVHQCGDKVQFRPVRLTPSASTFSPDADTVSTLVDSIDELTTAGVEVVVLDMPLAPAHLATFAASDLDAYRDTLSEVAQVTGASVIRSEVVFTDDDFADTTHLNGPAAYRFTESISVKLGLDFTEPSTIRGAVESLPTESANGPVCAIHETDGWVQHVAPGPDGEFELVVEPGRYRVATPCPDPALAEVTHSSEWIDLLSGDSVTAELQLS